MIQSALTPQVEVPVDTEPPELYLNGAASLTLRIGEKFSDPGTYVIDASAATVTSTGVEFLEAANLSDLGTVTQDGSYGPYLITYTGMSSKQACCVYGDVFYGDMFSVSTYLRCSWPC